MRRPSKRRQQIVQLIDVKLCQSCGRERPAKEFRRHHLTEDGLQNRCWSCIEYTHRVGKAQDSILPDRRHGAPIPPFRSVGRSNLTCTVTGCTAHVAYLLSLMQWNGRRGKRGPRPVRPHRDDAGLEVTPLDVARDFRGRLGCLELAPVGTRFVGTNGSGDSNGVGVVEVSEIDIPDPSAEGEKMPKVLQVEAAPVQVLNLLSGTGLTKLAQRLGVTRSALYQRPLPPRLALAAAKALQVDPSYLDGESVRIQLLRSTG